MQWLMDNKTKALGTLTTVVATLLGMIALGMFDATADGPALLDMITTRWMTIVLSILNVALGGGTVAAGVSNTTAVRVAEAKAEVARTVQVALETPPPPPP